MFDEDNFFKNNIRYKETGIQDEHKKIVEIIYDYAVETGAITKDGEFSNIIGQYYVYSDLKQKTEDIMSSGVLITCLHDLEIKGFIMDVCCSPNIEHGYGITTLGKKYLELNN